MTIPTRLTTTLHLAALLAMLALIGCNGGSAADDPHAGHDHAEDVVPDDPHAGHDPAEDDHSEDDAAVDPHAGHDHAEGEHAEDDAVDPHAEDLHAEDEAAVDPHAEDLHAEDEAAVDPHAGHDHAADGAEQALVELTQVQQERIGLRLATATPGSIARSASFPGEIIPDPDRTVHVVPRAAGIVRAVAKGLGDHVEPGEILAWIESDTLAEAKLAFYSKRAEVGCCQLELPRAREIFENTTKLLALLETEPGPEALSALNALEMGEYRGRLIKAYAGYAAAKRTWERERDLYAKQISSETELIEAETRYKQTLAEFAAAKDIARYQVLNDYTEAARKRQVAEFEAVAAEQRLRLKGVDDEVVASLLALVPNTSSLEPCLCDDPDCTDDEMPSVLDTLGGEERLGWYAIRAPFDGTITEKHLTLGEKIDDEESIMTIADTSSVWVRFNVYQKDLALVSPGQAVRIEVGSGIPAVPGVVRYVAPLLDRETRTAPARVRVPNPDGRLRPGLYATVHVSLEPDRGAVVVEKQAIQFLDGQAVVFVPRGDAFLPVEVTLGRADDEHVVVVAGLEPGQAYVAHGAFDMKAQIVTSGIDPHAGHGH